MTGRDGCPREPRGHIGEVEEVALMRGLQVMEKGGILRENKITLDQNETTGNKNGESNLDGTRSVSRTTARRNEAEPINSCVVPLKVSLI